MQRPPFLNLAITPCCPKLDLRRVTTAVLFATATSPPQANLTPIIGYLDDLTLGGEAATAAADVEIIEQCRSAMGRNLNRAKWEVIAKDCFDNEYNSLRQLLLLVLTSKYFVTGISLTPIVGLLPTRGRRFLLTSSPV